MIKRIVIFLLLIIIFATPKTFGTSPLPEPVYFNEYIIEYGEDVSIESETRTIHLKQVDGFSNTQDITHAEVIMNHQIMNHTASNIETKLAMMFEVPMLEAYITKFSFMKDNIELPFKMYSYYDLSYKISEFLYSTDPIYTFDEIFDVSNEITLDTPYPYSYYYENWVYFVFEVTLSSGMNYISHSSILPLRSNQEYYGESAAFHMMFDEGRKFMDRSAVIVDVLYEEDLPYYIIHSPQQYEVIDGGYRFTLEKDAYMSVTLNTTGNAVKTIHAVVFIMIGIVVAIIGTIVAPIIIIVIVLKKKS